MAGEFKEGQEVEIVIEKSGVPRPFDVCPSAINVYSPTFNIPCSYYLIVLSESSTSLNAASSSILDTDPTQT